MLFGQSMQHSENRVCVGVCKRIITTNFERQQRPARPTRAAAYIIQWMSGERRCCRLRCMHGLRRGRAAAAATPTEKAARNPTIIYNCVGTSPVANKFPGCTCSSGARYPFGRTGRPTTHSAACAHKIISFIDYGEVTADDSLIASPFIPFVVRRAGGGPRSGAGVGGCGKIQPGA